MDFEYSKQAACGSYATYWRLGWLAFDYSAGTIVASVSGWTSKDALADDWAPLMGASEQFTGDEFVQDWPVEKVIDAIKRRWEEKDGT